MAEKTLNDVVNKLKDIETKLDNQPTRGENKLAAAAQALNLKESLKSLGAKLKVPFTDLKGSLVKPFKSLKESITKPFNSLKESITKPFKSLKDAVTKPFSSLKDAISKPFSTLKKGFTGIGNFFKNKKEQKTLAGLEAVMKEVVEELKAHTDLLNKIPAGDSGGDSLGDIEEKKEQRKLLVRIAEALEGGAAGGGGEQADIKASGGVGGVIGKLGKGLGEGIGGLLKGIGGGFKYLGKNFGNIIKGVIAVAAIGVSLIPAAKAFQMFGDVTWSAVAMGLTVLGGLALVAAGLSLVSGPMLIGAAAIGVLALAMLPAAKAFEMFAKALNEHVMPALRQFQPIINDFIDRLVENFGSLAEIVEGFIAGTVDTLTTAFERGAEAIGGLIQTIANEVKEIAKLDGDALLKTAAGITAVGGALAAFGAGGTVGKILGSIGDGFAKLFGAESPIDQLKTIADLGPRLEAGIKPIEELPKALARLGDAIKDGFDANIEDTGRAIQEMLELIDDGIDEINFDKLDKLTGLTIQMGTAANADAAAANAAPTIINNYFDNSQQNSTNVNSTTLNETNIADDNTGSPAFS
jgi:hypothetical protein